MKNKRRIPVIICFILLAGILAALCILSLPVWHKKLPGYYPFQSKQLSPFPQASPIELITAGAVDLNTADEKQLRSLSGIGAVKAQAIIAFRENSGHFYYPEDVMLVNGIGEGIFNKIKDYITCGD